MRHSAVIITRNRPIELRNLLESLVRQTVPPDEIVIVDSSDDAEVVQSNSEFERQDHQTVISWHRSPPGIALQRNLGLDKARGDNISFFDDDCILDERYCEVVLNELAADSALSGIIGVQYVERTQSLAERMFRFIFLVQREKGRNRFRSSGFPEFGHTEGRATFVDIGPSVALTFRSQAVSNIRIPPEYFSGSPLGLESGRCFGEDVWFSWQLGKKGLIRQLPSAMFQHHESERNRDDTETTQALYVYAMRMLSDMAATGLISRFLRLWALSGQAIINLLQSLRFGDSGYLKGYFHAMHAPLVHITNPVRQSED